MNDTTQNTKAGNGNKPTHVARLPLGHGKKAGFETLGVAWDRGDGSFFVKPYGVQIIEGAFYLFPVKSGDDTPTA